MLTSLLATGDRVQLQLPVQEIVRWSEIAIESAITSSRPKEREAQRLGPEEALGHGRRLGKAAQRDVGTGSLPACLPDRVSLCSPH